MIKNANKYLSLLEISMKGEKNSDKFHRRVIILPRFIERGKKRHLIIYQSKAGVCKN